MLTLPIPVSRALRKLGHDIKDARRRRRIPMAIAARAGLHQQADPHQGGARRPERFHRKLRHGPFCHWAWRTGWPISPIRRTTRWACSLKKKICRSAFAERASRSARKDK